MTILELCLKLLSLLVFLCATAATAQSDRVADQLILPPNRVLEVLGVAYVNQQLIDQDRATPSTLSVERGTNVYEVRTTALTYYVRFFKYATQRLRGDGLVGRVMPADSVRGLSMEQVRSKFSLPERPEYYIAVRVISCVTVRTATAGPIRGWGRGGVQQYLLMEYISLNDYCAVRPSKGAALIYAPYVGCGNAASVARYIDRLTTPPRYSDLDIVLDNLNLQYNTDLAASMHLIGPQVYDSLTCIDLHESIAAIIGMDEHLRKMSLLVKTGQTQSCSWMIWARLSGQRGDFEDSTDSTGFVGYDALVLSGGLGSIRGPLMWGVSVFYTRASFDWTQGVGSGYAENINLGLELTGDQGRWFWEAALLAGASKAQTSRRLRVEDIGRNAIGAPEGWYLSGQLGVGLDWQWLGWVLRPALAPYLLKTQHDGFKENGAESLNLEVESRDASTFVGRLALRLSRVFDFWTGLRMRPELCLSWQHNSPLDDRAINASSASSGGRMTVCCFSQDTDAFAPSMELALASQQRALVIYLRYDGQLVNQYSVQQLQAGMSLPF